MSSRNGVFTFLNELLNYKLFNDFPFYHLDLPKCYQFKHASCLQKSCLIINLMSISILLGL